MKLNVYAASKKYQPRLSDLNSVNKPEICVIRVKMLYLRYLSLWVAIFHTYKVYPSLKFWYTFQALMMGWYFCRRARLCANCKYGNTDVNKVIPNDFLGLKTRVYGVHIEGTSTAAGCMEMSRDWPCIFISIYKDNIYSGNRKLLYQCTYI